MREKKSKGDTMPEDDDGAQCRYHAPTREVKEDEEKDLGAADTESQALER